MGADSPNVGLIVACISLAGEHSVHGPIWNVSTPGPREIVTEFGATGLIGQMADEWLRPLPGDAANDSVYNEEMVDGLV